MANKLTETEVFGIDLEEFHSMDAEKRLELTKAAGKLAADLVQKVWEGSDTPWVVIGGVPPHVIATGHDDEALSDEMLEMLGTRHNVVPYFFTREF